MNNSLADICGEVLKQLRTEAKISQENLAYESELDRSYISQLERGIKMPTLNTLFKISKALNRTPSEIIKSIEEKYISL